MRIIGTIAVIMFALTTLSFGQVKHKFHETYDMKQVNSIQIDLAGEVEYKKWEGNSLMIETNVSLSNASKGMMNHLVKKDRYVILDEQADKTLKIISKDKNRKPVITKKGECEEVVKITVFIPRRFSVMDEGLLARAGASPFRTTDEAVAKNDVTGDE